MVTYLRRNVTIVCGASYHLLGSQISRDLKIRFQLQVESYISNWQFSKLQHLASYVTHLNAMAYDTRTQLTQLLGEYSDFPHLLPTTERDFLNNLSQQSFDWPINLIAMIKNIINKPCNTSTPPEFSFKLNGKAAF
jgi:hypothetical protein